MIMLLGSKLKSLRTAKKYSPDLVADKLGISKSTYGRYERDESTPDVNILEKIATLYEIELYDLLSDEKIVFTQNNKKSHSNGLFVFNQLSDKIIELYESRIFEKDTIIREKNEEINKLKNEIDLLKSKQ